MSNAYVYSMIERLVTMLAIIALFVMTMGTTAHAARMSVNSGSDHAMHVADMMHAAVSAELGCDAEEPCGSTDAEMCKFVCAGISALLTAAAGEPGHVYGTVIHDLASEAIHISRTPGLNERPPKLRLL